MVRTVFRVQLPANPKADATWAASAKATADPKLSGGSSHERVSQRLAKSIQG